VETSPAISVIRPAFNASRLVARAVESVRCQTFADWVLLAVDDGSADDTYQVLCAFQLADERIRLSRLPVNKAPPRPATTG
jgi:glycosyltransferase involved in cell wall biosynthesis